jgi:hypothetical protein
VRPQPGRALVDEYAAQAVSTFDEAVRMLPKLSRSHRKLFALLGVDPRVGLWAAVMLAQPSLPFQQAVLPVSEILRGVGTVYCQTMNLLLRPGPCIPAQKQAELWQQHLQLPRQQLQLERQLTLLVPCVILHGAARLPTGRTACLKRMFDGAQIATQANPWWMQYSEALPGVAGDPWLQGQVPVQWVEDMLSALLKLGGKAVNGLTATAAAAQSSSANAQASAAASSSSTSRSSSTVNTESSQTHMKLLMCTLECTVATLGQVLQRCVKSATDGLSEAELCGYRARGMPLGLPLDSDSPTLGLLRASLAAAADAFAIMEGFLRAAAAGIGGGFNQDFLSRGVFECLFFGWQGTLPAASLCCQTDEAGKSARAFYSLLTGCLKLQSTHSAPPARLCASAAGATFLVCHASIAAAMWQDRYWPTALLQAAGMPMSTQGSTAVDGLSTWYDPASRLPSVVLFGRCCLLFFLEDGRGRPSLAGHTHNS